MQVQGLGPDALHRGRPGLNGAWGGVRDEALEGAWLAVHCLRKQSLEQQAAVSGVASVEAKDELVEVARQVVGVDRSLRGAEQPALEQRGDAMTPGKGMWAGCPEAFTLKGSWT